ncbi:MAG: ribosomal RNA small subunit methyltransferase A [Bacteroidetes bacterium HLUCCA01]|nr:MAG: ribosomal RNA small subunit methyltransferase A [Bacteroidetes bacterium HLUCCA01]
MQITPKKSLGQHFLTDSNIIRKIADAVIAPENGKVVEIGPGTGAVTGVLLQRFPGLEVVEIDPRAADFLQQTYPGLTIHRQDILKTDWNSFEGGPISVVGNLPYYITSPILFSVLDRRELFTQAVFMMQREVALRLTAQPRTKDYGILSVQTQLWSRPEYLFTVSRNVFHPRPNVESAVVRLTFDTPDPGVDRSRLKLVVRTAFSQRRKTLNNALKPILKEHIPDDAAREAFAAEHQLGRRAEELQPNEFIDLTRAIYGEP